MLMHRRELTSLNASSYYYIVARCVRRQFLCGVAVQTGRDFTHRRDRIRTWSFKMAEVYAVGMCAYAMMSNR